MPSTPGTCSQGPGSVRGGRGQLAHLEAEAVLLLAVPLIQPPAAPWWKSLQTRKQEVPSSSLASEGSLF